MVQQDTWNLLNICNSWAATDCFSEAWYASKRRVRANRETSAIKPAPCRTNTRSSWCTTWVCEPEIYYVVIIIILKCIFVKCVMVFYSYLSVGGYLGYINERTVCWYLCRVWRTRDEHIFMGKSYCVTEQDGRIAYLKKRHVGMWTGWDWQGEVEEIFLFDGNGRKSGVLFLLFRMSANASSAMNYHICH